MTTNTTAPVRKNQVCDIFSSLMVVSAQVTVNEAFTRCWRTIEARHAILSTPEMSTNQTRNGLVAHAEGGVAHG